ncbi:MAG: class I SAM-dependent DNA methyltransferase [Planctomycetota bacterium]|jgi:SAM-dependent methyltransferase
MFDESSRWYDHIYAQLDYAGHAAALEELIPRYKTSGGNRLLDIACGTGRHLECFSANFEIEGLDLNPELLGLARTRLPDVPLHEGDFCDFDLGSRFDVITNLFSSIGYAGTRERLDAAIACVARHLERGGVALIEPWFRREVYFQNHVHMTCVDEEELKICRMNRSDVEGDLSILDFHYLVSTPEEGTRHFTERHELAMFAIEDFAAGARAAGLAHNHLETDRFYRGLHVLQK